MACSATVGALAPPLLATGDGALTIALELDVLVSGAQDLQQLEVGCRRQLFNDRSAG